MSDFLIVCVDDEIDILEYIDVLISELGYKTKLFTNPIDAHEFIKLNHKKILFVCSDFKMPEMTGFDFRAKLLEDELDLPFMILTGFASRELAVEAMRLKIREFIEKPIVEADFNFLINKYAKESEDVLLEEREMVSDFLTETSPMLDEIEDLILALEENSEDEKAVNTYFRLLHTIKGTSSCLGLNNLALFAHKYEDLITRVKERKLEANSLVINALLKGFDYLKEMYACEQEFIPFPHNILEISKIFEGEFKEVEIIADNSQPLKGTETKVENSVQVKDEKISISVELLSEFLEMSGEITVLKNTIFKILTKMSSKYSGDHDLEQLVISMTEMNKVSSLLQNQVSEMKKISIDSVFRPMKRVVRDSSKICHKNVNLITKGDTLKIDTSVGKLLNNVLVHMLRNSVDHGIELPDRRIALGKKEEGTILLSCYETGENIIVEIEDDGNGIDSERIKAKALEKGLYTDSELNSMSKTRVFQILFESGFSTAEQVTAVSGRGVGMDMVKSSIEEFGGRILTESEFGKGSKFTLTIPIPRSVLIIKSLMIYSLDQAFTVPLDEVEKVVLYEEAKEEEIILNLDGHKIFKYHDRLIPLVDLRDILAEKPREDEELYNIVILRGEDYSYGIIVDRIEDIEEIVVKKLSHPLDKSSTYQGVTFIGDGEIGLILNAKGIAEAYNIKSDLATNEAFEKDILPVVPKEYMQFLIEGDTNYCLPLEFVNRLEVFAVDKIEFSADQALIKYREGTLSLLKIEKYLGMGNYDIESYLENKSEIDVIVVSHKGYQKGIIVDSVHDIGSTSYPIDAQLKNEKLILGTVFIDEKINTVLDIPHLISMSLSHHLDEFDTEFDEDLKLAS